MWPTSLAKGKQCQSGKEATSASAENVGHSAGRCLRTRAPWGAGVRSWKHIQSSHICLFLCQTHHCRVWPSPLVCRSESYFSLQSKSVPSLLCNDNQSASDTRVTSRSLCTTQKFVVLVLHDIESSCSEKRVFYTLLRSFKERQWIVGKHGRKNSVGVMLRMVRQHCAT